MYEGDAPTLAFTPQQHVVDARTDSQQAAAIDPSPQGTYTRLEKHGAGNYSPSCYTCKTSLHHVL